MGSWPPSKDHPDKSIVKCVGEKAGLRDAWVLLLFKNLGIGQT